MDKGTGKEVIKELQEVGLLKPLWKWMIKEAGNERQKS
jgi:hypothetical protein